MKKQSEKKHDTTPSPSSSSPQCMATFGRTALKMVLCVRLDARARPVVSGNLMVDEWNCLVASRLVAAAATVAVLMMWREAARTRWRDAISAYS